MVFKEELVRVELPHLDPRRWKKLQDLYRSLQNIEDSETLVSILQKIYQEGGHDRKDLYDTLDEATGLKDDASNSKFPFSGLQIFLDDILGDSQRKEFYERTLPFIANLASKLDENAPVEGIKVSCQQEPCSILLDRKFIASILASGFLCALPENNSTIATRTINFDNIFADFHRSELKDIQAAKLQSFLCYFEKLASSDLDYLSGEIIFERQVVKKSSLPSLADWMNCDNRLCPMIVDQHKKIIDSEPSFLQVDFCNCFIGGNLLGNKHGQQELNFSACPELLVATMFMESLGENESLFIKGAERFSTLGSSNEDDVHFAGVFQDTTERDICGNLQRAVVSVSLIKDYDTQNKEKLVLRLLNKALVCFYSQGTPCALIKMTDKDGINNGFQEDMDKEMLEQEEDYEDEKDGDNEGDDFENEDESGIAYIDDEVTDINGNIQLSAIDTFCDSLVSCALSKAKGEIGVRFRTHSEDTRQVLENLMKKSVHEVFKNSPEKQEKYKEKIIESSLIPKCLQLRAFQYSDLPLVPGTPPSSPTRQSLVSSGNQAPVSGIASPNTPLSEEVRLGTTSFADSLAESLMSCVMLSSSLATSIATIASTPLRITSVALETLKESPVKNGQLILSSFLSPKLHFGEKSFTNGSEEFGLIDLSTENDGEGESNLYMDETSEEENEARRRSLNELALNLFQDFASQLADSIVKSAKGFICKDLVRDDIDEEHMEDDDDGGGGGNVNYHGGSHGDGDSRGYHRCGSHGDNRAGSHGDVGSHGDYDDGDNSKNSSIKRTVSSGFQSDGDYNPENSSQGKNTNKEHDNEANNDKNKGGDNHELQSTDSDSEQESAEGHWEDIDIDKELEDRLYELDLTDNEDSSSNNHQDSVAEMADMMVKRVLGSAYEEAARELKEKAELYGIEGDYPDPQMQDKLLDVVDLDSLLSEELPRSPQNGFLSELCFEYAKDFSTRVFQEALLEVSKKFEPKHFDEENLEICYETEKVEEEQEALCLMEDLDQIDGELEILDENDNVKANGEKYEDFESGEINSSTTTRRTSISEDILNEFAHVLSEQLLETSVAIADASMLLEDESLLIRPIAIGSWSCGELGSDPELEAVVQWVAASVVGCPAVVYCTSGDSRIETFSKVQQILRQRDWRVRDVIKSILRYCQQDKASKVKSSNLFEMLLEKAS
ncbi:uncharacterized protein LOC116292090 [Actinia tenebrosa]|uniref:poly(ADP-ribose) glycohydrolase n=1 Tax=Actinia tenebrosa TaxID=6105 RepID=A0A6P8HRD1_ACTTE|nr:uncharacterized protein LOC116292090 [Actinia tenebrosa]